MEWLTPLTALIAAAVTVPLLLLLYFLKLKRREQIISSTLLWKRAVQDLQVNAPFQRLRRNILLLLQLLMLLAMLFALAGPILSMTPGPGRRYVVLIDRSASMNATDVKPNRLEAAKAKAKVFVESLRSKSFFSLKDTSDETMVIAFDNRAKVLCSFTSDKRQLIRAIESIEPSDGLSCLVEATVVARAFTQSSGGEGDNPNGEEPARLVLFSDGDIRDMDQIVVGSDELVFHCIGKSQRNVAVTAMQARRSYEKPEEINVFATLANYGPDTASCDVQLSINNDVRAVKSITVPPCKADDDAKVTNPGQIAVDFTLMHTEAGVLEVRQLPDLGGSATSNCLSCDDAAWAVLSSPKRLSILLVTGGNTVLESALRACPLAQLERRSPAEFDAMDHATLSVEQPYDVIVLDGHVPSNLPKCRYLVFGRPPDGIDVTVPAELENQVIVDWRTKHPALQYVNLANLFAARCHQVVLPGDADVLAEFNETPALSIVRRHGSVFLLAGFDVLQTNWPFEPGFVLFCYNATSFLGRQIGRDQEFNLQVGDPIVVEDVPLETSVRLYGPDIAGTEVTPGSSGSIRFSGTSRAGPYRVSVPDQPVRLFAVNLLDPKESNVAPRGEIVLAAQPVQAQESTLRRANVPLWPYFVGLVLTLVCLEWFVYNRKVRI